MHDGAQKNPHRVLAERTKMAHEALHVHPYISRLLAKDLTAEEYASLLYAYMAFYRSAENRQNRLSVYSELSHSSAVHLLQQDLQELGIPHCKLPLPDLAFIKAPIDCLAANYVLSGAQAGAAVIARKLEKHSSVLPKRYFSAPRQSERWAALLSNINSLDENSAEFTRLCSSANITFTEFGRWVSSVCDAAKIEPLAVDTSLKSTG